MASFIPAVIQTELKSAEAADSTESKNVNTYVLRAYDDSVMIFSGNNTDKIVTDTGLNVSSMRDNDKKMFEKGVAAESWKDVLHLIEDFSS